MDSRFYTTAHIQPASYNLKPWSHAYVYVCVLFKTCVCVCVASVCAAAQLACSIQPHGLLASVCVCVCFVNVCVCACVFDSSMCGKTFRLHVHPHGLLARV